LKIDAVRNHRLKHLTKTVEKAGERRVEAHAGTLLDRLEALYSARQRPPIPGSVLTLGRTGVC
ncbi:MAG TPA: hypothetical protein VGK96_22765, partial [Candidatus Sulfotelmatobacter sp.]